MTEAKHTPGPLTIGERSDLTYVIRDTRGQATAVLTKSGLIGGQERMANAHLYRAAPDMLEALKNAEDYLGDIQKGFLWCQNGDDMLSRIPKNQVDEDLARVKAAIAKAEGGDA